MAAYAGRGAGGSTARLREEAAARDELAAAQLAARDAQIEALTALVEELRRRMDKDSSTSSKPPSSDSPYKKKPRDRSLRGRSGRRPGKQPGEQSSTLKLSPDPMRGVCGRPRAAAAGMTWPGSRCWPSAVTAGLRASPPPAPTVTEYQAQRSNARHAGRSRSSWRRRGAGRVQYGPECTRGRAWRSARTTCRSPAPRGWSPR